MTDWEKVEAVVAHLVAHPEEHDQRYYGRRTACGTAACMAGRAMLAFAPDDIEWLPFRHGWSPYVARVGRPAEQQMVLTAAAKLRYGTGACPAEAAQAILGLSMADADWLFLACSTLGQILAHLAVMRKRDGLPPLEIGAPA